MAAIKRDKSKALAALTSAALSLPGLNTQAAIPSSSIKTNVSYGRYEESDNRMTVDVYHADAVIPLSDRFEVRFSLDRDTYSGATPAYSLPSAMTNMPKYDYENPGVLSLVDITSAASSQVTPDLLTLFFLNQFKEYKDGEAYVHPSTLQSLESSDFFQALLAETEQAVPVTQITTLMPFAQANANTQASVSANLQPITEPQIEIATIKDKVYDYISTTGDFLSVMETFFRGKTRTQLIDDYLKSVESEMHKGAYGDETQQRTLLNFIENAVELSANTSTADPKLLLGANADAAFDAERNQIGILFTQKNEQLNAELGAFKDDIQNKAEDINTEFTIKIKPITDQYLTEKSTTLQTNAGKEADKHTEIAQVSTEISLFSQLKETQTLAINQSYLDKTQQIEKEYSYLNGVLTLLPELHSDSDLLNALTSSNSEILSPGSPFTAPTLAGLSGYTTQRRTLDQQIATLDSNLITQLNNIQNLQLSDSTKTLAADLANLLTNTQSAWLQAKQNVALNYLKTDLVSETEQFQSHLASLRSATLRSEGLASADLTTNIDALNSSYQNKLTLALNDNYQQQSALEQQYNANTNPEIAKQLITLRNTYENNKTNLLNLKTSDINQYKTQNPPPSNNNTIDSPVTIDFPSSLLTLASYGGAANKAAGTGGKCSGSGLAGCYEEDGFAIGIVGDSSNSTAHLHKGLGTGPSDKSMEHHADSTGIYLRALNGKAFSLDSMSFSAPITADNPDSGTSEYWEILGFNQAANPNLDLGDGTNYATRVAYQTVANGFDGMLSLSSLNADFKNVNAVWIHYRGYAQTPKDGKTFDVKIDNINISPVFTDSAEQIAWNTAFNNFKTQLDTDYAAKLKNLEDKYLQDKAAIAPNGSDDAAYQERLDALESAYAAAKTALDQEYESGYKSVLDKTGQYYSKLGTSQQEALTNLKNVLSDSPGQFNAVIQSITEQYAINSQRSSKINDLKTLLVGEANPLLAQLDQKFLDDKALLQSDKQNELNQQGNRPNDGTTVTLNFPNAITPFGSTVANPNTGVTYKMTASYGQGANEASEFGYVQGIASLGTNGLCPPTTGSPCYVEDNFLIGSPTDPNNGTNHIHRIDSFVGGGSTDRSLGYHADSTGIYIRALDGSAFDLTSMRVNAEISSTNPIYGPAGPANENYSTDPADIALQGAQERWEIFGFANAANPNLSQTDGYATAVAYASIANGFDGLIGTSIVGDSNTAKSLGDTFKNIKALWIHYNGYPSTPLDGISFDLKLDNIILTRLSEAQLAWHSAITSIENVYKDKLTLLTNIYNQDKTDLESQSPAYLTAINNYLDHLDTLEQQQKTLQENYKTLLASELSNIKNAEQASLTSSQDAEINALSNLDNQLSALEKQYNAALQSLLQQNQKVIEGLQADYEKKIKPFADEKNANEITLYNETIQNLRDKLQALSTSDNTSLVSNGKQDLLSLSATANIADATTLTAIEELIKQYEDLVSEYQQQAAAKLAEQQASQIAAVDAAQNQQQQASSAAANAAQALIADTLAKQNTIALYKDMLNKAIPQGTPTVERFMLQPQETRSMPQFNASYYWDSTTVSFNGGLSDEPDFLSNFGSFNLSHEFNDKLTTVSAGYGMTSNQITRGESHSSGGHDHGDETAYPNLNEESTSHNFNAGISQVLGKNSLYQFSTSFTHQTGYLSNPYKTVYIRGEVTAEEYYLMNLNRPDGQPFDWKSITNLEMVSTELFREVRPDQRNMWSFSNRLNQHLPELDASLHFDYRFYLDDWGINSHTFELKWYQNLPGGWTITPGIRYYSQSQAEFFAPYFLAPRADGHYSSDFRLSAFGDLSGGVTVSKQFARGITLEAGIEYVTHSGDLKLGGGGVGDYADFDYYIAHANLNIDFSARPFTVGEHAGHHMHHHHGAPVPAGIMFGHMMNQADEIMIGYRYQYNVQSGSMLTGSDPASDAYLVANTCTGNPNGCLYKPTKMHMQMHMLDLMYAPTDWLNIMIMPQLMSMDMTMGQPLRELTINEENHGGTKHSSNDLGDTVVTALVKVHDDNTHHVHAGIGMSAPTGNIDAQISQGQLTDSGGTKRKPGTAVLQDYGMQLGSGTWDFKPSITYTGHADDWGWGMQLSGMKRIDKNKYGYAYGDLFQTTGWGSYQIFNWLSASVRGVYTWQDKIRGESKSNHENTSPVDFTNNYGGRFIDVGLGLNLSIPDGKFAGNSLSVEWLQPVVSDFNGSQLDREGSLAVTWNFSF